MATTSHKSGRQNNRRNHEIRVPHVRVIGHDATQLGILARVDALRAAEALGLDLVEIQPNSDPPVCRIMDYGKFRFASQKKAQAARRKQKQVDIKEVKFRPVTDVGDYQIKLRHMLDFLSHGDKVKVTIRFRGREMLHQELGHNLARRIQQDVGEHGQMDAIPRLEGRQMVMMIDPRKKQ